jgi:Dual specificity phosphatase, catalytic domain
VPGSTLLVIVLQLYWIRGFTDGHLAIMPAPQPETLERAIVHWKEEGVEIVVSLLELAEVPGLVEAEGDLCNELGVEFLWFPIRDGSVPVSASAFNGLIARLGEEVVKGKSVAIHCRAGIGRSVLVAASVLNYLHIDAEAALDMLAEARKLEVPQTEEQRQWILGYQPARLG